MKLFKLLALVAVLALGVGASIAYAGDNNEGGTTTTQGSSVDENAFWCWIAHKNPTWVPPSDVDCQPPTTTTTPCNQAHPCTGEDCLEYHAADDCARPETTTTVPKGPTGCENGAGHDGKPGNDDCATTTTTPLTINTTPLPPATVPATTTTTPTTTDESGSSSTTTTTEAPVVPAKPKPSHPANRQAAQGGTLPNTGSPIEMVAALGAFLIGAGLTLRRKFRFES